MLQNPAALPPNQSVNVAQINGVTPAMGNGVSGTGVQRVTIASDSTGNLGVAQASTTSGQLGPMAQGAVTTSAPTYVTAQTDPLSLTTGGALRVDQASVAGTATSTGAGVVGAGVQRVTLADDAPAIGATGSAVVARTVYLGGRVATTAPTAGTDGNNVGLMADAAGRLVVTEGNVRNLISLQTTTISASTTETTIVSAGGAGVFCDISEISISTTNAAAATLTLKDATSGTTRAVWNYPATAANPIMPLVLNYNIPMAQAASNNNWTITASVNAGNFIVNVVYLKTK